MKNVINTIINSIMRNSLKQIFVILSFVFLGTGQMWGTVVSGTTYNFNKNYTPAGWDYSHRTGESKSDYLVICKPDFICSETFFQQSITSIVINMRKYGGTDAQATVTLTWVDSSTGTETALGTLAPANGNTLADATIISFTNTPTANTSGYIKFTCPSANSLDKGAGIKSITINYTVCSKKFDVGFYSISHGSALADKNEACPGEIVTVTLSPDANYGLDITNSYAQYYDENDDVNYKYFDNSFFTKINANTYTFVMPTIYEDDWFEEIYFYIYMTALPNRSVTWHVPSGCVTTPADGTSTTANVFPNPTPLVPGYKFEGWVTSEISGTQSSRPATVYGVGEPIPSDGTYYALYSSVSATFTKVTDAIPIDGKNYILCNAYSTTARAWKNVVDENKRLTTTEWDCSSATTTCTDWDCIWTFKRGSGTYSDYWFIYNSQVGKYLGANSTTTSITTSPSCYEVKLIDDMSDASAWQFSVSSGRLTLTNKLRTANGTAAQQKIYCSGNYAGFGYSSNTSPYFFEQGEVSASYTTNPAGCATTYTVTYNAGGGTGTVTDPSSPYDPGDEVTVLANGFTKTDYNFTHWTANVDVVNHSTSATITEGSVIAPGTHITMPSSNVVLTANWEAKTYLYGSSCEPLENITVTYNDAGSTTNVEYGVGTQVTVDSRTGTHGCAEWTFVGWQRGSAVANNSTSYTPVHNFTAAAGDDGVTFYAVYEKVNTDWISALTTSELKSGATYVIVKTHADNNHRALTTTVASTNYLAGTLLSTDCEKVRETGTTNDRYKLKVTPTNDMKWECSLVSGDWRVYNKALNKYLKINSDNTISLSNTFDAMTIADGVDLTSSDIKITSNAAEKGLYWDNTNVYWKGHGSPNLIRFCTNSNSFTSTPDCGLRTVRFNGNGGTVTDGVHSGTYLDVTETVRDQAITTPTATFADCNGKSWSFIGWADHEIDVTRVPVLTTDLLNDGGGNKSHTITASNEEYWAVFSNTGAAETKSGTINIVPADIHGDYRDELTFTKTVTSMGDYTFAYYHVGDQSSLGIQFDYANATKGYLKNTTSLGKINSISFSTFGTGSISDVQVYVGNSADACNTLLTAAELQTVNGVSTYYPKNNYAYVKIQASGYVGIGTISIDFGKGTQVWATTPDCSTITLSGTPRITSYAGKTVKGVTALTVNAQQLKANTPLTFAAYNVADDTPNNHFGFVGSISPDASGEVSDETIIVTYTPDAGATTDGIEEVYFKATALADDEVTTTESNKQSGYGRHLPTKFVIATKVEDKWYGMPNNVTTSTLGVRELIPIAVDDATSPTTATVYTSTTDYLVWNLDVAGTGTNRYANMGDKLFFSSPINSNRDLYGESTGLRNSAVAATNTGYEGFAWTPTTTDLGNYTLQNGSATTYYIGTDGSENWTMSTTSANVRFLGYYEQTPAVITWYNDMLGEQHGNTTTVKTDGTIPSLPSGENPAACPQTTLYTTFVGWGPQISTPSGYITSAPTLAAAGDFVGSSNVTYHATFKHSSNNWWRTSCPNYYTITYQAGTGTGSDYVVYAETASSATPSAATAGMSKDGYTLAGWTCASYQEGAIVNPEAGLSSISTDLTFTAVWAGNITITAPNGVWLTSYNGVSVYTTSATSNNITISTAAKDGATGVKITYFDGNGTEITTLSNSLFRLCNDGSSDYNIADNGGTSKTDANRLAELTQTGGVGDYKHSYSIRYTPNAYNTTDTYTLKVQLMRNSTVLSEATLVLHGRALPQKFVIAAKIGGEWRALPANMAKSANQDIPAPYPISVDYTNNPTIAYAATKKALYAGAARPVAGSNVGGIRLKTQVGDEGGDSYHLQAPRSNSSTYLWRTTSSTIKGTQSWYLESSDLEEYHIHLDPDIYVSSGSETSEDAGDSGTKLDRKLSVYSGTIGWYKTDVDEFHILPVTDEYDEVDMQVVEWKSTGIVFMYKGNPEYKASVEIDGVQKSAAPAVLGTSLKVDHGVYEIAVSDLATNAYKSLYVIIWDGSTEVGRKRVNIPILVSGAVNRTTATTGFNQATCTNVDLVILPGGKLTVDDGTKYTFKTLTIYGGGKLVVATGKKIGAQDGVYMRAGSVTATTKGASPVTTYNYVYPQVYLEGTGSELTAPDNIIYFDHVTNYDQYFGISFPYPIAINSTDITYPEDIYGADAKRGSYLLRMFDSKIRASQGAVDAVWADVESTNTASGGSVTKQDNTTRGLGYYLLAPPRKVSVNEETAVRQKYGLQRMKMNIASINETSNASISLTYQEGATALNSGWNLLGNPFMADLTGDKESDDVTGIMCGKLAYEDGEWKMIDTEVRYITVPEDNAQDTYDQRKVRDYNFPAFKPFYVQIGTSGTVTFSTSRRKADKRALMMDVKKPNEVEYAIALNPSAGAGDTMYLLVGNAFSDEYEIGDDLYKMPHSGTAVFTIMGGTELFANALSEASAMNGIPVGYTAPESGNYTFSLSDREDLTWLKHLWLVDKDLHTQTDLLTDEYLFTTDALTNKTRFVLNIVLKTAEEVNNTPTGSEDVQTEESTLPEKFIYQDKLYIYRNGVIYDAVGKKVK